MMSETVGKLDGLRDIIAPVAPEIEVLSPWVYVGIVAIVLFLNIVLYRQYAAQPHVLARKLFRKMKANLDHMSTVQSGNAVEQILRTMLQRQNIYIGKHALQPSTVTREEWRQLLDLCTRLRFSSGELSTDEQQQMLSSLQKMLWQK